MDAPMEAQPFRLLDLPAELRNHMYSFIFGDDSPTDCTNIFDLYRYAPEKAVTQTSRQIRSETIKLYRLAVTEFWSKNNVLIPIDCTSTRRRRDADEISQALYELNERTDVLIKHATFSITSKIIQQNYGSLGLRETPKSAKLHIHVDDSGTEEGRDCVIDLVDPSGGKELVTEYARGAVAHDRERNARDADGEI
ncbi:hypothetical protein LTR37_008566 [Vermiconidia calcicola]|uniref:Uncharacterized protein n=1 Tax=Vermiconidia calcicola TaxID=1690605 RepID=A0ACC3NBY4_9PEZI|nr:hypothetical protein LTR37_008566 [Vermiconidia calcicola]